MINKVLIRQTFLIIFLIELLSLAGYFFGFLNSVFFFVLSGIFLIVALRSLPNALLIIFAELFIGSKGYLFYTEILGISVSIRLMFFLIIMIAWLYLLIKKIYLKEVAVKTIKEYTKSNYLLLLLLLLCCFILFGTINALIRGNSFHNLFFDLNGWLFFGLLFPLFSLSILHKDKMPIFLNRVLNVFLASTVWLSFKTLLLLYLFSHLGPLLTDIYRWVRQSGIGEITMMPGNFYRIFIQSQIFILAGIIISLILIAKNKKKFWLFVYLVFASAATIVSLSRSNWLGLGVSLAVFFLGYTFAYFKPFKNWLNYFLRLIGISIISILFVFVVVKIPWPNIGLDVSAIESLRDRTANVESEAGAASRWSLWPEMIKEIKKASILGKGFGATVSYKSSDPRALEASSGGYYTTYAFEWGWLDVWLKLGVFGLITYAGIFLFIIFKSLKEFTQKKDLVSLGVVSLMILLATINFFSPYLNHPLGIGYLLLLTFYYSQNSTDNSHPPTDSQNC